jgi:hypothetical protein
MDHPFALVRFNILNPALRASIVPAATPNISPLFEVFGAAIIIYELPFGHVASLSETLPAAFPARHPP